MARLEARPELPQNETGEGVSRQGVLLILAGLTGSGKTEVLKGLMAEDPTLKRVVSTTTRQPRLEIGERNGVDYHFTDTETFLADREHGVFLETEQYGGNWYGTKKCDIEPVLTGTDVAWIVNMAKARKIEETYRQMYDTAIAGSLADRTLLVLIGIPTMLNLYRRYQARGDGDFAKFRKRISEDLAVWNEHGDDFTNVVINRDGELVQTVDRVKELIELKRAELVEKYS